MASIINLIRGTDHDEYFDLFERAGANVARAGDLLDEIVASVAHCGPLLRHGGRPRRSVQAVEIPNREDELAGLVWACLGTSSIAENRSYWFRRAVAKTSGVGWEGLILHRGANAKPSWGS